MPPSGPGGRVTDDDVQQVFDEFSDIFDEIADPLRKWYVAQRLSVFGDVHPEAARSTGARGKENVIVDDVLT